MYKKYKSIIFNDGNVTTVGRTVYLFKKENGEGATVVGVLLTRNPHYLGGLARTNFKWLRKYQNRKNRSVIELLLSSEAHSYHDTLKDHSCYDCWKENKKTQFKDLCI